MSSSAWFRSPPFPNIQAAFIWLDVSLTMLVGENWVTMSFYIKSEAILSPDIYIFKVFTDACDLSKREVDDVYIFWKSFFFATILKAFDSLCRKNWLFLKKYLVMLQKLQLRTNFFRWYLGRFWKILNSIFCTLTAMCPSFCRYMILAEKVKAEAAHSTTPHFGPP